MRPTANPRLDSGARLLLAALLVAGFALRVYRLDAPLVDHHAWKQADLAGIARNYAQGDMRLLYPRIDWGGDTPGYAEMEFPLLPYLAALLYRIFGESEAWGRALNVASGLVLALLLFGWVRRRAGLAAGIGAFAFALFSPIAWFYGRTYMQEVMGWAFALGAVVVLDDALAAAVPRGDARPADPPPGRLIAAALLLALALLCKLNTIVVLLPMLAVVAEHRGLAGVRRPWVAWALALAALPPLLWYVHAHGLYQQTGLTFGILGTGHDKFQTLDYLSRFSWWREMGLRGVRMVATPPGVLLVLLGLPALLRERALRPLLAWGVAAVAFTLLVAEGSWDMEYYQLVLVVPTAAAFGLGVAALWRRPAAWARGLALLLVLATMALGARRGMAMTGAVYGKQYEAGHALARHAWPGDLVVNLGAFSHHQGGDDFEPNIFYYSRTHGWVLRPHEYRAGLVDSLRLRGARFAVTSRLRDLLQDHPAFLDSLGRRYPVLEDSPTHRVWALEPGVSRAQEGERR
jgi:hypothetical protein